MRPVHVHLYQGAVLEARPLRGQKARRMLGTSSMSKEEVSVIGRTRDALIGELERRAVYAHMPLSSVSQAALQEWARKRGVIVPERGMHVTTAYSQKPVKVKPTYRTRDNAAGLVVSPGGRKIEQFGKQLVLCLDCSELQQRWQAWREAGADWDYPDYQPHVTFADLKHQNGATIDIGGDPFDEPLHLLPEVVSAPRTIY